MTEDNQLNNGANQVPDLATSNQPSSETVSSEVTPVNATQVESAPVAETAAVAVAQVVELSLEEEKKIIDSKLTALKLSIQSQNVPGIVGATIDYAITVRASDIHIEPLDKDMVRIRFRIDGSLNEVVTYPMKMHAAIVSRIKIISNLKIDEQRLPQDGRAQFTAKNSLTGKVMQADLRVSILPTVNGEKIVMRIQDKSREIPNFDILGIMGQNRVNLETALAMPNGILLVSGPTGSGKTTTLYAALNILNKVDVNIMTIEDPVEYEMPGLAQSQMHPDIGYSFAEGLRTALRQDPDIIMLGEIRDAETIEIAVRAALTGHLVMSTIHTNSAIDTITRILNMGIPGYLITASTRMIVAQRLVRKICENCKVEEPVKEANMKDISDTIAQMAEIDIKRLPSPNPHEIKFFRGAGCDHCHNSGYKGRFGIYEVLLIGDELAEMINKDATRGELLFTALKEGMTTLKQDGIIKAAQGITTIEEVYRVANTV